MTERDEYALQAAAEAYQEEVIQEALRDISLDGIASYVSKYGDAIEARIAELLDTAGKLLDLKHSGPALACSCTAIEVTIRHFLLSPLVQGAFLSEEWAEILTKRITSGRAAEDRDLLPAITGFHGVDLNQVKTAAGDPLWGLLHRSIWPTRNNYVHKGNPVSEVQARQAMGCALRLREIAEEVLAKAGVSPTGAPPELKARVGWVGRWSRDGAKESPFT